MDNLKEYISTYKLPIAFSLLGLVLLGGGIVSSFSRLTPKPINMPELPKTSLVSPEKISKSITIDVSGAVKNPGVYQLGTDSRVEDAIRVSGGFASGVNKAFVAKQLNLAAKLNDGAKLYIPFAGETASAPVLGAISTVAAGAKINLNSSSQAELESLPGIGAVTAAKIITLRPFASPGELLSKKAISKSVYEKVKDLVDI